MSCSRLHEKRFPQGLQNAPRKTPRPRKPREPKRYLSTEERRLRHRMNTISAMPSSPDSPRPTRTEDISPSGSESILNASVRNSHENVSTREGDFYYDSSSTESEQLDEEREEEEVNIGCTEDIQAYDTLKRDSEKGIEELRIKQKHRPLGENEASTSATQSMVADKENHTQMKMKDEVSAATPTQEQELTIQNDARAEDFYKGTSDSKLSHCRPGSTKENLTSPEPTHTFTQQYSGCNHALFPALLTSSKPVDSKCDGCKVSYASPRLPETTPGRVTIHLDLCGKCLLEHNCHFHTAYQLLSTHARCLSDCGDSLNSSDYRINASSLPQQLHSKKQDIPSNEPKTTDPSRKRDRDNDNDDDVIFLGVVATKR